MTVRKLMSVCFLLFSTQLFAGEPSMGPIIEDYGPTYPINYRDVALEEDTVYKIVFDTSSAPGDVSAINSNFVSVARFLNMHGRNGVPIENMDIAVVVHGSALKGLMTHDAYDFRYQTENPNLDLLMKLEAVGVKFYACGQSMHFQNIENNEMDDIAQVGLSAMTLLTVLQNKGYAILPW